VDGLEFSTDDNTTALSGSPTAAGTFTVDVEITDTNGGHTEQTYTLTVDSPPAITTTSLPSGTVGVAYKANISASGGSGMYEYALGDDSQAKLTPSFDYPNFASILPLGLSGLSPIASAATANPATLSGVPTQAGVFDIVVTVTDASTMAVVRELLSLTINPAPAVDVQTTIKGSQTLPETTISVASTTGFPTAGSLIIETNSGNAIVSYTGTSAHAFTGCSGESGTLANGGTVLPATTPSQLMGLNAYSSASPPLFLKVDGYGGTNYPPPQRPCQRDHAGR